MNTSTWSNNWMSVFICFEWFNELLWVCQQKLYITYFHFGSKQWKRMTNHVQITMCVFPRKQHSNTSKPHFFPHVCCLFWMIHITMGQEDIYICLFNSKGKKKPLKVWTCWNHNVWTCLSPNTNFLLLYA